MVFLVCTATQYITQLNMAKEGLQVHSFYKARSLNVSALRVLISEVRTINRSIFASFGFGASHDLKITQSKIFSILD